MKTYGSLKFQKADQKSGDSWVIKAEPHVALRVKRMFAELFKGYGEHIKLSDSIDTCRDLVWLMERYPLKMSKPDRDRLSGGATQHVERESLVDRLIRGIAKPRAFQMALAPRDYQMVAGELVLRTGRLLLGDDLGLGKTCSAFCMIADPSARPALVVTRSHLAQQWRDELKRFCPELTSHILKKGTPYDLTVGPRKTSVPFPDVIITTSNKLSGWRETLAPPIIRSVTFDEVQEFRHGQSTGKGLAAAALSRGASYRMGLSGTPFFNLGGELYYIIDLLAPGALGTRTEFVTEWCGAEDQRGRAALRDPKAFGSYLRDSGLYLRRTRAEVGRELPPLTRVSHVIEYDRKELDKVEGAALTLARKIVDRNASKLDVMHASEQLSFMLRHATGVAKAPYVADFVRMLLENEEPTVLFAWHHDVYRIYRERLKELPIAMFTGEESPAQKNESKRRFIAGEAKLLIMSLRAGDGTDGLQKVCRTVVFGELDWTPAVHEQDIGRVFRDGQLDPVVAYFLLANDGSDPEIADGLQLKRAQIEGVRNLNKDVFERLEVDGGRVRRLAERYLHKHAVQSATA